MNSANNTYIRGNVRCGRETPQKDEGATSANITENGVNSGLGRKADGTIARDVSALVTGMTVNLDPKTGIVTTEGGNDTKTYGNNAFGVNVSMTVAGSGTKSVKITYTITFYLTGGTLDEASTMENPVTIEFIYTGEKVENN